MSEQGELVLGEIEYSGSWQTPLKGRRVLCSDGKRRNAHALKQPDTCFSMPATVQVKGKTVTGYLTGVETNGHPDVEFRAYRYGKNGGLLP